VKTKRNKRVLQKRTTHEVKTSAKSQPFTAHLLELRRRITWIGLSVTIGAAAAYGVQQHIVALLLRPAGRQEFIYTSPGGGLNFLVQICVYSGVLVSIPVIIYNVLKFIEPVMPESSTRYILRGSFVAGLLAIAGIIFGFVFGLPSALKFLAHQFTTDQIKALIAVQSYMHFVTMFLLASALIFQAPLIMLLINRIKPMNPGKMLKLGAQRWVILISFILGAVISPTPDIRSMMILSVPMIISFEVGIGVVWHANHRRRKPKSVLKLLEQDAIMQAERFQRMQSAFVVQFAQPELATVPVTVDNEPEPVNEPETYSATEQTAPTALAGGRTNYQFTASSQRVRRRIML
jgi:sec-independent protein translocase protein TatC